MPSAPRFETHYAYFASIDPNIRPILVRIQYQVEQVVPGIQRCISYNMPAYRLDNGKTFFYFAAFKKHIGVYPPVRSDAALLVELAPYRGPKGNLIFPFAQPMPYDLIRRVAATLAAQCRARTR
jgi:uncharacterized protein YdhG (YjbR/CyaY superfamily)